MKPSLQLWMLVASCLWIAGSSRAVAQRPGAPDELRRFLFFEAVNLPSPDSTRSRVDVLYRVNTQFFVPVKNSDAATPGTFAKHGEILIELHDSTDFSSAREIRRIDVVTDRSETDTDSISWSQGVATFHVLPGRYRLIVEVNDLESNRKFLDRATLVRAVAFKGDLTEYSTPLFLAWSDSGHSAGSVVPQNYGGNLLFGSQSALLLQMRSRAPLAEPVRARFSLNAVSEPGQSPDATVTDSLTNVVTRPGFNLVGESRAGSASYQLVPGGRPDVTSILIPLPSQQLPLRIVDLTVWLRVGAEEKTITKSLRMVWPDMPTSLRDVDYALGCLRYITRERELDSLRDGPYRDRRNALERFWKGKDKTPQTAYNEVMTEYYRRVDYAARSFGDLRELDGSRSDRGRTYILHGPPSRTERVLSPTAAFQEVWYYDILKKKFVFLDKGKSGNYILHSTEGL